MSNLTAELLELCNKHGVEPSLVSDLLKMEKSNLSSNRWWTHKASLEQIIKKYI